MSIATKGKEEAERLVAEAWPTVERLAIRLASKRNRDPGEYLGLAWQAAQNAAFQEKPGRKASPVTFITTVVLNSLRDEFRREDRHRRLDPLGEHEVVDDDNLDPAHLAERIETIVAVQAAVDDLPELERLAIEHLMSGMKTTESADLLGVSVTRIEKLRWRAKRRLRETLREHNNASDSVEDKGATLDHSGDGERLGRRRVDDQSLAGAEADPVDQDRRQTSLPPRRRGSHFRTRHGSDLSLSA